MSAKETMDLQGYLTIQKRDLDNQIIQQIRAKNDIVLAGRELVAKLFLKDSKTPIDPKYHIAIGTGTKPIDLKDTKLESEIFRKPINPESPIELIEVQSIPRAKITLSADLGSDEGNGCLAEAAIFTAQESGTMYNRVVLQNPIQKTTDFKLSLVWEILF